MKNAPTQNPLHFEKILEFACSSKSCKTLISPRKHIYEITLTCNVWALCAFVEYPRGGRCGRSIMPEPSVPPTPHALSSSSAPLSRATSRKEVADDLWETLWASGLMRHEAGSPKGIMTSLEGVELATLNLDEDREAVMATEDVTTTIAAQLELLSGSECDVVGAAATLTEMIQRDQTVQEEIRTAGGIRSAVFLLKLSQTAGNQRIGNAASRLLLHLARDNARNQDEISTFEP